MSVTTHVINKDIKMKNKLSIIYVKSTQKIHIVGH